MKYIPASEVQGLKDYLASRYVVVVDSYIEGRIDERANICKRLDALLASAVELPTVDEIVEATLPLDAARSHPSVELPELCETVDCKNHVELRLCRACIDQMIKRNAEQRIKETRPASAVELPGAEEDGVLEAKANYVYQRCKELTSWMADEVLPRIRALATRPVPDDKLREAQRLLVRVLDLAGEGPLGGASYLNVPRTLLDDIHAALRKEGA